jgi:hypothetical protein
MQSKPTHRHLLIRLPLLFLLILVLSIPTLAAAAPAAPEAASPTYLPIASSYACYGPQAPTVFGVQMYGNTGRKSPYFRQLQDSGASWVRVSISWRSVEPANVTPSGFQWAEADRAVAAARDACAIILATIEGAPEWAAPQGPLAPIKASMYGEYAQFVRALAERYNGDGEDDAPSGIVIRHWEISNEPDGAGGTTGNNWGKFGDQYGKLLQVAYPAIKSAWPADQRDQARVVLGGIAYDLFTQDGTSGFVKEFLDDVLNPDKGNGCEYFDIANFHYYPAFRTTWTSQNPIYPNGTGLPEKTRAIRSIVENRCGPKPVIVTEAGWHSNKLGVPDPNNPTNLEIQAEFVVRLFAQAKALDLRFLIWWPLHDLSDGIQYQMGLVTDDLPPVRKPAFEVYRAAVTRLAHAEYLGPLSAAETQKPNLEAYRFRDRFTGETFYVAWLNPYTTKQTTPLQLSASKATVYDIWNRDMGEVQAAANGQVTVDVGSSPIYIVID